MEQTDSGGGVGGNIGGGGIGQNKNKGIFRNSQTYVVLAIIVIAVIIYFSTRGGQNQNNNSDQASNQQTEQSGNSDQPGNSDNGNQNGQNNNQNNNQTGQNNSGQTGNVSANGTLRNSDNPARGNLMVESPSGKIYISTKRDFASQIDKQVTLQAEGTLNKFTFLGFAESNIDTTAKGGAGEETPPSGNVSLSGKIQNSDNEGKGNYFIESDHSKVYLKTAHDYSSLVGSEVSLSATGTINSFTNALVTKK